MILRKYLTALLLDYFCKIVRLTFFFLNEATSADEIASFKFLWKTFFMRILRFTIHRQYFDDVDQI